MLSWKIIREKQITIIKIKIKVDIKIKLNQILRDEIEKKKFKINYIAIKSLRTKFNIIRNNMIFLNFLQLSEINTALVFDWDRLDKDKVNKKRYIFI